MTALEAWMIPHTCLAPGHTWLPCDCDEIDPADRPCLVCGGRESLIGECAACRAAVLKALGVDIEAPEVYQAQLVIGALTKIHQEKA